MTVIAWDGKTLAADKRAVNSGLVRTVTKIRRIGNLLCGFDGVYWAGQEMFAWIERGRNSEDFPKCQLDKDDWSGVLVIDNGKILKYERSAIPVVYENDIMAIGSGRDFAIAAMYCGKTAEEAVGITCLFECYCGNGVDVIEL